jgi:alpha-methylacyl-CoA racemase
VVELGGIGPSQYGCMLLSDLGASVVRVDRPADVPSEPPAAPSGELVGRGRQSIAVDLKSDAGREVVLELFERADVVVDPFRPGVVERLGIGPEVAQERNPRIVYARMTGWGQTGPLAQAAGHDINYIALAGALDAIGEEDEVPHVPLNIVADYGGGGALLAFGISAALLERERSGKGQAIDVAMVDGVASQLGGPFQLKALGEWEPGRGRNWLQGAAPWYRPYRTADGRFVTVGPLEAKFYALLLERLGLDAADWPQWDRERWPALRARLEEIFAAKPMEHWRAELEGTDVCFSAAVRLEEVMEHPHLAARGTYVEYEGHVQPAPAPRFERTPGAIAAPPPWPGEHSSEVLADIGIGDERRRNLLESGAVAELG